MDIIYFLCYRILLYVPSLFIFTLSFQNRKLGDLFEHIFYIFINIFIMMIWNLGFIWGLIMLEQCMFFFMFFFQQLMRRTSRQKFVFLLGNPQALVVVLICFCTLLFSVTNYSFVSVICHVFVMFFLEMK